MTPGEHRGAQHVERRVAMGAAVVVALALAFLVGRDGSPAWQAARAVAVAGVAAVGVVLAGRTGSRGRGALAFSAGLVGFTVGVGIGGPHLAKTGLTTVSVAGLAALGAGIILLVAGGHRLLRGRGWRVRLVAVPSLLVLVALSLLRVGQAVAVTNVPRTDVGPASPARFDLTYEDVEVGTADDVRLAGWYVPSTTGAAVVLRHGAGSTRGSVLRHGAVLAGHGYGVLMLDARGHGGSAGRAMDFGWYGDRDLAAAVGFLARRPDVTGGRIGVVGLSMGGEEAIGAAGADGRIRAVVAEGATNRVAGDKAWLSDDYGVRGLLQEGIERVTFGATDLLTAADPPPTLRASTRAAAPRPVLLIAAGEVPDEARAARFIAGGSPDTVEIWVVPGADHTGGLASRPAEWERRVVAFLDAALGVADG